MTIEEQNKILKEAIFEMGKFIRQNPPALLDGFLEDIQLMQTLVGGTVRDPEGKEYAYYFINKAVKELKQKEEE